MRPAYCNAYANAATMRSSLPLWPFHVLDLSGKYFLAASRETPLNAAQHGTVQATEQSSRYPLHCRSWGLSNRFVEVPVKQDSNPEDFPTAEISAKQNLIPSTTSHGDFRFSCIPKLAIARAAADVRGVSTANRAIVPGQPSNCVIVQGLIWPRASRTSLTQEMKYLQAIPNPRKP